MSDRPEEFAPPHLILIPGLLNDADLWADQVPPLSKLTSVEVADVTRGGSLEELARGILDAAPARFAVAGFSFGGYVAQEIARLAPGRLAQLALLDTSIRADTVERRTTREALDRAARVAGKFHGFGDKLLVTYLHPENIGNASMVERIRGMTERLGVEVFLRQNAVERKEGASVLRRLTCPVLIACGDADRLTPLADHEEMARLPSRCRLMVISKSGHMAPIENPEAVTDALTEWLMHGHAW